ncbi:hypothetical protein GVAV_001160 [Gurleya vavrai]
MIRPFKMGMKPELRKKKQERLKKQIYITRKEYLFINDKKSNQEDLNIGAIMITIFAIPAIYSNTYNSFHYLTIIFYFIVNKISFDQEKILFSNFTAIKLIDLAMRKYHFIFYIQLASLLVFYMYSIFKSIICEFGFEFQIISRLFTNI